jgi:replicative DNA helicase
MEMKRGELLSRIACGRAGIDGRVVRNGELTQTERHKLMVELDAIRGWAMTIWDNSGVTLPRLAGMAAIDRRRHGARLLVIDYLGLIEKTDHRQSTYAHVSDATRKLKNLASELEIPILLLCQLNRDGDGTRPRLSHLRDSGSIEQDANIVCFTHRENDKDYINIEKHRNGDVGSIEVVFDRPSTTFRDVDVFAPSSPTHPNAAGVSVTGTRWNV